MIDLRIALVQRPYPGRGLVVGWLSSGAEVVVYFLTGRSEASRARVVGFDEGTWIEDGRVVETRRTPRGKGTCWVSRIRRTKRTAKHHRPVVRIGEPDPTLTGLAGLAALDELLIVPPNADAIEGIGSARAPHRRLRLLPTTRGKPVGSVGGRP